MKPLFIPLKRQFYEAFCNGSKDTEFRLYGKGWNEKTCPPGRPVTISLGYGKQQRRTGTIIGFYTSWAPTQADDWRACYGDKSNGPAACIRIRLDTQ